MIIEKKIPFWYLLKKIIWNILAVTIFSSIIHTSSIYLDDINLPISIGAFLGTAIALLLSFKLSQSYDRWWEARKIWGAIVNDSRTLVLQLKTYTDVDSLETVKTMSYRQIAWCYALAQSLRKLNVTKTIEPFISNQEMEEIKTQQNIPLAIQNQHIKDLRQLHLEQKINDFQQIQIDSTLVRLCASMGKSERIKNTAFPKTYRLTLHIFIYLFLIVLCFSLTELHSFIEIPLLIFISIPFFLLEKIAFHIQDPFEDRPTDTPVSTISRTIEINIKELLGESNLPKPFPQNKYYIM